MVSEHYVRVYVYAGEPCHKFLGRGGILGKASRAASISRPEMDFSSSTRGDKWASDRGPLEADSPTPLSFRTGARAEAGTLCYGPSVIQATSENRSSPCTNLCLVWSTLQIYLNTPASLYCSYVDSLYDSCRGRPIYSHFIQAMPLICSTYIPALIPHSFPMSIRSITHLYIAVCSDSEICRQFTLMEYKLYILCTFFTNLSYVFFL